MMAVFQRMVPSSNLSCFVEFYLSKEELIQSECQQADGSFSFCCEIFTHVKQLEPVSSADPRADPSGLSNDFGGGLLVTQLEELFHYMKYSDINNVNIGGRAHQIKNILAARSKVFFEENLTRQAEIEDIEPEVIELLYLFIQTVEINIPAMGRMAIYLLIAADKYHTYGQSLTVAVMITIQDEWEKKNSVYAKFECSKGIMRNYFDLVSKGAAKTKIFTSTMANTLSSAIHSAFDEEVVTRTFKIICNERWLFDARNMHKHMDLHLIDLLEEKRIDQVLDYLRDPKRFYTIVLHRLIAVKIPNVEEEWILFKSQLKDAVKKAALATNGVDKGLAQTFANQLRDEFSEGRLQSDILSSAFSIDCTGEYEECDNEDEKKFQEDCEKELDQAIDSVGSLKCHEEFAKKLSPKVVQYMKTLKNQTVLPRCDSYCPCCFSLCIEAVNHNTADRPHDSVHQPSGVVGVRDRHSKELCYTTCSQYYDADAKFYVDQEDIVGKKYKEFTKEFPGWKDPRIKEDSPLREYILATYNKELAEKHLVKPCPNVPASYFRVLSTIKEQLKMEID